MMAGDTTNVKSNPSGSRLTVASRTDSKPAGAVLLTDNQVSELVYKIIDKWQPEREMWPLKYSCHILGALSGIGGGLFITHLRKQMKLASYGRLASILPTVFLPALVSVISHDMFVTRRLLNSPDNQLPCPVCMELRAVTLQVSTGVIQPIFLSILATSALAKLTSTYPLPPLYNWRALSSTYSTLLRPMRLTAGFVVAVNVVNAVLLTHGEAKAAARVRSKLLRSTVYM